MAHSLRSLLSPSRGGATALRRNRWLSSSVGKKRCVLSGIQPTGVPHIGNYVGAMRNWVALQTDAKSADLFFMIADYHAITFPQDPEEL